MMDNRNKPFVLVRGAGDIATGVIQKLLHSGMDVIACETAHPSAIRRYVALCEAVYEGRWQVEDIIGIKALDLDDCKRILTLNHKEKKIEKTYQMPIIIDSQLELLKQEKPDILIDAILAKKNLGTQMDMAFGTIALGPGFSAGKDVKIVIETMRGHDLGRLIFEGPAMQNTGTPGIIAGYGKERVIHSPATGAFYGIHKITDMVDKGEIIGKIGDVQVTASISGIIRGMIRDGYMVSQGFKIVDIDPRHEQKKNCFTISDKARTIGGAALEAVMILLGTMNLKSDNTIKK